MSSTTELSSDGLLEAIAFAARRHRGQLRKDKETPYFSHVARVCMVVRHLFGVEDEATLTAAVLHDTVEDTTTDFDDLEEKFGKEVAAWVSLLSKDKRLPEEEREQAYVNQLRNSSWQVKVCKLADVYDNLTDSQANPSDLRARTIRNARRYLEALEVNLPEQARWPFAIVSELFQSVQGKA